MRWGPWTTTVERADAVTAARSIFVTGASSGIGRHLAETLAARGHHVHATARRPDDLEALAGIPNVTPVELDVRSASSVARLPALLTEAGRGLDGLVNNAGVGGIGPLAAFSDDDLRDQFEVNVFGPHRLTNALTPLLAESRGRIVNVGSQGGVITGRYYGAYSMTKHALEAFTSALAEELQPHGVSVSIVQPGGIVSEIGPKSHAGTLARLAQAPPPFTDECRALLEAFTQAPESEADDDAPESAVNRKPSPPDIVTEAVLDALFSERPRRRYLVGTRWEGNRVIQALLERLAEANDSPSMGLARDELVARLDRALEQIRSGGTRVPGRRSPA